MINDRNKVQDEALSSLWVDECIDPDINYWDSSKSCRMVCVLKGASVRPQLFSHRQTVGTLWGRVGRTPLPGL